MTINIDVKDALGSTQTIRMLDDGTGKKIAQSVASDATGAALIGQKTMAGGLPVSIASDQSAIPVSGTVAATQSGTWNIGAITTLPTLPAGTNVIGKVAIDQTTPGTTNKVDIGNTGTVAATQSGTWNIGTITTLGTITNVVHIDDNAGSITVDDGGSSVSIDDNGGSVTVDAPVTTPVFVRLSDGTSAIATLPVSGTFWQATQPVSIASLPALAAGSAVIGKVSIDQTTPGTTNLVALAANQSVNVAQMNGVATTMGAGVNGTGVQRVTIATDDAMSAVMVAGTVTSKASYTRPADTAVYAINDVLSNSTSAPTAGGLTFAMARASGKGGVITDVMVTSSAPTATTLQGELWLFDQAPTAVNDNAAWALSDADILNVVAVIPFSLIAEANNSWAHVQGLNIGYTCVGSANLRGLVKVKNVYTPISGEVVQFALKGVQNN